MSTSPFPVFDGHNDVLLRLHRSGRPAPERAFIEGERQGHLDLPRARRGGFAGGFFAIFVPSFERGPSADELMTGSRYDVPLPPSVSQPAALQTTLEMAAILFRIEREAPEALRVCRNTAEIRRSMAEGAIAAVLHIEGAEAIDPEFHALEVLHKAGLRSLGPVWSRPNIFAHGVPFRFPSGPDIGPGLTEHGRALVRQCNRLKVMLDLSHLNEAGFWDAARLTDAPLVATHSNAHALSPHSRNLTDRQLAAIAESRGMVGVNFATSFLRGDGRRDVDTGLDAILRHLDYLIERVGIDGVGLGSDFDGATIPAEIPDVAALPNLVAAMRRHGYDEATLAKLCHGNWVRVLELTWG